jgi:hypothetical protein
MVGGQPFLVSGPHPGTTTFGQPVQYWELVNRDRFLYWDGGQGFTQYVHAGEARLRYDAGRTRLLLYSDVLRRYYENGGLTPYTVQYIENLTGASSFPASAAILNTQGATEPEKLGDSLERSALLLPGTQAGYVGEQAKTIRIYP